MTSTGGGVPLALVSAGMSLSLSVALGTVHIFDSYHTQCGDAGSTCWRWYTRVYGIEAFVAYLVGLAALFFFRPANYPWLGITTTSASATPAISSTPVVAASPLVTHPVNESDETAPLIAVDTSAAAITLTKTGIDRKVSAWRTVRILLHPYFQVMFLSYFGAVGAAVSVNSTLSAVWSEYVTGALCTPPITPGSCAYLGEIDTIASVFSYCSAGANVVGALIVSMFVGRSLTARTLYIATTAFITALYVIIATLVTVSVRSNASAMALAACLGAMGVCFGFTLNFGGIFM